MVQTKDLLGRGRFEPLNIHLKNLVKDIRALLHTNFKAPESRGSEEEDF